MSINDGTTGREEIKEIEVKKKQLLRRRKRAEAGRLELNASWDPGRNEKEAEEE